MTEWRIDTSFPYLRIAQFTGVPYALVLWYAAGLEAHGMAYCAPPPAHLIYDHQQIWIDNWPVMSWAAMTRAAFKKEQTRRAAKAELDEYYYQTWDHH